MQTVVPVSKACMPMPDQPTPCTPPLIRMVCFTCWQEASRGVSDGIHNTTFSLCCCKTYRRANVNWMRLTTLFGNLVLIMSQQKPWAGLWNHLMFLFQRLLRAESWLSVTITDNRMNLWHLIRDLPHYLALEGTHNDNYWKIELVFLSFFLSMYSSYPTFLLWLEESKQMTQSWVEVVEINSQPVVCRGLSVGTS